MEDYHKPEPRKLNSARQRQANRYRRKQAFVTLKDRVEENAARLPRIPHPSGKRTSAVWQQVRRLLRDAVWYLVYQTPVVRIGGAIAGLTIVFLIAGLLLSPNIPPNIYALNIPLSGYTVQQAEAALLHAWQNDIHIQIMLEGSPFATVAPEQIGLHLDAKQMVEKGKGAGLSGIPFGVDIAPIISLDFSQARQYLLSIVDQVYIPPYEAGYRYEGPTLVGVPGTASRELDIALTLERLRQSPETILVNRRLDLLTTATPPGVSDPSPYLAQARAFLEGSFKLIGYDPFTNEFIPWGTTKEEMAKWLAAGANSLTVREDGLKPFINAVNERLKNGENPRYLDAREVAQAIGQAVLTGQTEATLRIRYLPLIYEIEAKDIGYSISRKTGMPFGLIDAANPGLNWNQLSIGQEINLPSPDELLPEPPVTHKRIVVDLDKLWLVAYENGQMKFSYPISIGRTEAPTYPGIFQILSHNDVAYGSSFTLCKEGTSECGQWAMQWFMGIYEVVPGLMNGFHGDVLLPNGALLGGGGGAQSATTFGCVMADNTNAKALYDWAEAGTMVEIISFDYSPRSDLGRQAYDYIRNNPQIISG